MTRILLTVLLLAVLVLGATVGYFNAQTVRFDFLFGVWDLPLIALMISAFAFGVLIALLVAAARIFALRLEIRRLRQRVHNHELELRSLRDLPLDARADTRTAPPGA
jgi:lipopolysaccharide assembly protein A